MRKVRRLIIQSLVIAALNGRRRPSAINFVWPRRKTCPGSPCETDSELLSDFIEERQVPQGYIADPTVAHVHLPACTGWTGEGWHSVVSAISLETSWGPTAMKSGPQYVSHDAWSKQITAVDAMRLTRRMAVFYWKIVRELNQSEELARYDCWFSCSTGCPAEGNGKCVGLSTCSQCCIWLYLQGRVFINFRVSKRWQYNLYVSLLLRDLIDRSLGSSLLLNKTWNYEQYELFISRFTI